MNRLLGGMGFACERQPPSDFSPHRNVLSQATLRSICAAQSPLTEAFAKSPERSTRHLEPRQRMPRWYALASQSDQELPISTSPNHHIRSARDLHVDSANGCWAGRDIRAHWAQCNRKGWMLCVPGECRRCRRGEYIKDYDGHFVIFSIPYCGPLDIDAGEQIRHSRQAVPFSRLLHWSMFTPPGRSSQC